MTNRISPAELQIHETNMASAILLPVELPTDSYQELELYADPTYDSVANILRGETHLTAFQIKRISMLSFYIRKSAHAVAEGTSMKLAESDVPTNFKALIDPKEVSVTDCEELGITGMNLRMAQRMFEASKSEFLYVSQHAPQHITYRELYQPHDSLIVINTQDL